uniref:Uncharacterized protein n=1 Tax=Oryza punctata TaxID=4537 RepID=A0A0E0JZI9_ORYPU
MEAMRQRQRGYNADVTGPSRGRPTRAVARPKKKMEVSGGRVTAGVEEEDGGGFPRRPATRVEEEDDRGRFPRGQAIGVEEDGGGFVLSEFQGCCIYCLTCCFILF